MRWLFEDLETTPGQERTIKETVASFRESARESKASFKESLGHLAGALESDDFDAEAVGEAWVQQDKAIDSVRMAAVEALGTIHDALDPRQRERLAKAIRRGGRFSL